MCVCVYAAGCVPQYAVFTCTLSTGVANFTQTGTFVLFEATVHTLHTAADCEAAELQ